MTTISLPLATHLEEAINNLVKKGFGTNKADVIRKAITRLLEDEAVMAVLVAEQEASEGKVLNGDLKTLLKKI
jgi:Arc/MetJ-type ribon-helix-helix transcriptional regulator